MLVLAGGVRPGVLAPDALHVMEKGSLEAMLKEQNFKVGHIRKFISHIVHASCGQARTVLYKVRHVCVFWTARESL